MRLANPFDISGQLDNPAVRLRVVHWLAEYATDTGLGPVTSIEVDSVLIQIGIDPQHPTKTGVLLRWLDHLGEPGASMTIWRRGTSPVRLNLRAPIFDSTVAVVHTSYDPTAEADQIARIDSGINARQPRALLTWLTDAETTTQKGTHQ